MDNHKKIGEKKADKTTRDWRELQKNLIDSVFAGLRHEDCFADRGDANFSPNSNRYTKTSPKLWKPSTERRKLSETKSPKRGNHKDNKTEVETVKTTNRKIPVLLEVKPKKELNIVQGYVDERTKSITNSNKDTKTEDKVKDPVTLNKNTKVHEESERKNRTYLDFEGRKRLREKYTVKLKKSSRNCDLPDMIKDTMKLCDDKDRTKLDEENNKESENQSVIKTKSSKQTDEYETTIKTNKSKRRPIIETIHNKNDNQVYKAVTFGEKKPRNPIQIKIPSDIKTNKPVKNKHSTIQYEQTAVSSKEFQFTEQRRKNFLVKKKGKRLHQRSPSLVVKRSPVTEVAKWVPSCLNDHTKPYYEAWVDTTLAAVTKCSQKELYIKQQNVIENLNRAMERFSPEVVYEGCQDERHTGKITVRRK